MKSANESSFRRTISRRGSGAAFGVFVLLWAAYSVYEMPRVLFGRGSGDWSGLAAWMSSYQATALLGAAIAAAATYMWLRRKYGQSVRTYTQLAALSMVSGMGHALVIFIINEALAGGVANRELYIYFILGIALFAFCQTVIRGWLVRLSNEIVYEKRMALATVILNTSYKQLEAVESGKIKASMSHDANVVSRLANLLVSVTSWSCTIVFGFIYLGLIHLTGMLFTLVVVALAGLLFVLMGKSANRLWEQNRDIQNRFFSLVDDMLGGFRELYLHREKKEGFKQALEHSSSLTRDKQVRADTRMANVIIVGEVMFAVVLCLVVFLFPYVAGSFTPDMVSRYIVVFLYLTGPLTAILNAIPQLMQIRLSWERMNQINGELAAMPKAAPIEAGRMAADGGLSLQLDGVGYTYRQATGDRFAVGPIDYRFRSGEIVFITGGNGSGKSTLAKLMTGLYPPDQGAVMLNGEPMMPEELGRYYSAIFSDIYLFDRLYGIDLTDKQEEAARYLEQLRLQDKITLTPDGFSTTKLSTGQRKRLALLISYLEDRPICLFDEWAADQDPEFRQYFYETVLPDLKAKGKCVIAITHDDRYFDCADRILNMELGQIKRPSGSYAMNG